MAESKSKYAQKKGRQLYGPGCCGHKKSDRHMQESVDELRKTMPWKHRPENQPRHRSK